MVYMQYLRKLNFILILSSILLSICGIGYWPCAARRLFRWARWDWRRRGRWVRHVRHGARRSLRRGARHDSSCRLCHPSVCMLHWGGWRSSVRSSASDGERHLGVYLLKRDGEGIYFSIRTILRTYYRCASWKVRRRDISHENLKLHVLGEKNVCFTITEWVHEVIVPGSAKSILAAVGSRPQSHIRPTPRVCRRCFEPFQNMLLRSDFWMWVP